jgi:hypothetical protein
MQGSPSLSELRPAGSWDAFASRLREVEFDCSSSSLRISGHFFYLAFRDGAPTVAEFAKFIHDQMIPFCLPRAEVQECRRRYEEDRNTRHWVELVTRARNLFITAKKSQKTSGEPGELILFMLLEAVLGAPQIACKMYLKTARNMPVHGSDAVHALFKKETQELELIWGESKLKQELPPALDDICESLKKFISREAAVSAREHDIRVVVSHLNVEDPELRAALCKYFDPYEEELNQRTEAFACLVGFDLEVANRADASNITELEDHFRLQYLERIKTAVKLFEQKLTDANLHRLRFYFFLLPFPSIAELREEFFRQLGVAGVDGSL